MKIVEIRVFEGRNLYSRSPALKIVLDLQDFASVTTEMLGDFNDRLILAFPSLFEHYCSKGKKGGFVERLREGTLLGHVVEHIALELQALAGCDVIYGKTRQKEKENLFDVIFEYTSKEVGRQAAWSAVEIVKGLLAGKVIHPENEIERIKKLKAKTGLGPSTEAIARAARNKGIPVMGLGEGSLLQLGYGKGQKRVEAAITHHTGCIGVDIACNKSLTKFLLDEAGIPVPKGALAESIEVALAIAGRMGGPVTVKPYDGNHGKGVSLNLLTDIEITKAFEIARNFSEKIMVEKYIPGRNYRLLVVGSRVVAAAERVPAYVRGDGIHTIEELVGLVNKDSSRGLGHENPLTRIIIDPVVLMTLAKKGLLITDIPGEDELVYLRESANLSTGGTALDVTEQVHPETEAFAVKAARLIGLDVAGIDIVTEDISKPLKATGGAIIELNASPGLRMHYYPSQGKSRDAAEAIVDSLFPSGQTGRIPIVSVTGTNGKTTTVRLIGHILQIYGHTVGMTTTDGIYIQGKLVRPGDTTGPQSARAVLRDPDVEVAVLETARGGIIRAGLGYDMSDVGIVTNISADHLGQEGVHTLEDLADVKSLVAEAVNPKGYCVLNADDPYVLAMAKRTRSQVVFFSMAPDNVNIRRLLGAGGQGVFLKGGSVVYAHGTKASRLMPVKSIPLTLGGKALHNVQNVLAAVAGALALKVPPEAIKKALLSFAPDLKNNPGRLNILEVNGFKVLVDYGHNIAGYASIINLLPKLKGRRYIGVIGIPGDRLDRHIKEVGKAAGKGFHQLIIKEDQDLRGRDRGEVAGLLQEGALAGGAKSRSMLTILNEQDAVRKALNMASSGDVVVIFYEKLEPVLKEIESKRLEQEICPIESLAAVSGEQQILG